MAVKLAKHRSDGGPMDIRVESNEGTRTRTYGAVMIVDMKRMWI